MGGGARFIPLAEMCEVSLMIEVGHRSGEVRMGQGEAGRTSSPKPLLVSMPNFY